MINNLLLSLLVILIYVGCANQSTKNDSLQVYKSNFVQSATDALDDYQQACKTDAGKLWRESLCVPMIIVDRKSLNAVATNMDPKGLFEKKGTAFIGKYYGPQLYANTSLKWHSETWSMVVWPLPKDKSDRVELLIHEAWHSVQNNLGYPASNVFLGHLDQHEGRLLIQLEWNAILKSLTNKNSIIHIKNALLFRSIRFRKYPTAKEQEKTLDFNEGLAAYTGSKLRGVSDSENIQSIKNKLERVPQVFSLVRSASYYTGPLYGFLLDREDTSWKYNKKKKADFGDLLKKYYRIKSPKRANLPSKKILSWYEYDSINTFEHSRSKIRKIKIDKYLCETSKRNGVRIIPNQGVPQMFDPRGILAIGNNDLLYTYYETNDSWGTLKVTDGVRIKNIDGNKTIFLGPFLAKKKNIIQGNGWILTLKPGWVLMQHQKGYFFPTRLLF